MSWENKSFIRLIFIIPGDIEFSDKGVEDALDPSRLEASTVQEEISDNYLLDLLSKTASSEEALEIHLDRKPKVLTVSYDNIDGNSKSADFVMGEESLSSYHWCSSVIFEDVVSANEISDLKVQPSIMESPADVRMGITSNETEHLLDYYTQFVMHLIKSNWPKIFPGMKTTPHILHQYSELFQQGVNCWVGPLVCETESTIDGISKVITEIIDRVCPKLVNDKGVEVPAYPTVFSGDNKTEKMARSAQLALVENGTMRDRLGLFKYKCIRFNSKLLQNIKSIRHLASNKFQATS